MLATIAGFAIVGVTVSAAASRTIKVGDNWFVASSGSHTVTVKQDSTVVWKFSGGSPHNVTVDSGPAKFHSSTRTDGVFKHKMTHRGTYKIICTIHEGMQKMTLKVVSR